MIILERKKQFQKYIIFKLRITFNKKPLLKSLIFCDNKYLRINIRIQQEKTLKLSMTLLICFYHGGINKGAFTYTRQAAEAATNQLGYMSGTV